MLTNWTDNTPYYYERVDSTNVVLHQLAAKGAPHGTLVVADKQTAGRGRRGRSWESPQGCNIYFSLLLRPTVEPGKASMLNLVMACDVAKGILLALEEAGAPLFGQFPKPAIKWPNDILLNRKKICGILTEMFLDVEAGNINHVIVGVGINVKEQEFPKELADKAGSIEQESGIRLSRRRLTQRIVSLFQAYYEEFVKRGDLSGLMEEYNALLVNRNSRVCVLDPKGEFQGVAQGINSMGELLVELPDGSITAVYAGEVSVRGIDGYV